MAVGKMAGTSVMIIGTGGLLLGAYIVITSLPDVKRYVRISTM
jgi:hypothetical protein